MLLVSSHPYYPYPTIDCRSRCVSDAVHGRHVGGQLCVRLRLGQAGAPQRAPPLLRHVRGRRHGVGPAAVETGNVGTAAIAFLTQLVKRKIDRARYCRYFCLAVWPSIFATCNRRDKNKLSLPVQYCHFGSIHLTTDVSTKKISVSQYCPNNTLQITSIQLIININHMAARSGSSR